MIASKYEKTHTELRGKRHDKTAKARKRNVNDLFYEDERKQIEELNREFFSDVLVWLCGQDRYTFGNMVAAFRKVRDMHSGR